MGCLVGGVRRRVEQLPPQRLRLTLHGAGARRRPHETCAVSPRVSASLATLSCEAAGAATFLPFLILCLALSSLFRCVRAATLASSALAYRRRSARFSAFAFRKSSFYGGD